MKASINHKQETKHASQVKVQNRSTKMEPLIRGITLTPTLEGTTRAAGTDSRPSIVVSDGNSHHTRSLQPFVKYGPSRGSTGFHEAQGQNRKKKKLLLIEQEKEEKRDNNEVGGGEGYKNDLYCPQAKTGGELTAKSRRLKGKEWC